MLNNSSLDNTTGDANGVYRIQLPFGFTVFQLSLQVAIGVFGVTGNVLVCATIMRRTNKPSALSPYLLSLAFADLGILLFNHPLAVLKIQFPGEWLLGKVVCLYIAPFTETFFGASIWTITAIAGERYLKIAWKPIKKIHFGKRRSLKRTRFIIIAIWVISFAVTSMPHYLYTKYNSETKDCSPKFSFTFHRNVITINAIVLYVLPLSIIAFSYQRISKRVSQRSKSLLDETPLSRSLESSHSNARVLLLQTRKTQRILKPLVILFAVTMLPLHMFTLTLIYWERNYHFAYQSYFLILFTIVNISVGINAAADPLVYCVVNEDFRQEIIVVLNCCFRCQLTKSRGSRYSSGRSTGRSRGTFESKVLDTEDETEL